MAAPPIYNPYWADLKHKSKTRLAKRREDARGTGGGPSNQEDLSEIDKKILAIIGEQAVYGDTQHRVPVFVIPCVHPIPAGMYPGRMIRVQGSCPPGAQRFAINLQCGPNTDPRDDIALHLNFRFPEMCVVRNHLTAMNWGVEETNGGMPVNRGDQFEALVLCEPHALKVALNGAHFCEFPHRIPFQRISHLTVDGDVMIQLISFEGAQPQPQQMYMSEPPAYGAYGQGPPPPAYGAPGGYGQQVQRVQPPGYGGPPQGYVPQQPQYGQQPQMVQGQMQQGQQRRGMGAGAALGAGAAGMAAGGLAGYALGGGFNRDSPSGAPASFSESVDFGGDDWME